MSSADRPLPSSGEPRWEWIAQAVKYASAQGIPVPPSTLRRWAAQGRIPSRRVGPRKLQVDLNSIDKMLNPEPPTRWLTERDLEMARKVAASLLPLADWQLEKLSLLLHPGRGHHDAA